MSSGRSHLQYIMHVLKWVFVEHNQTKYSRFDRQDKGEE